MRDHQKKPPIAPVSNDDTEEMSGIDDEDEEETRTTADQVHESSQIASQFNKILIALINIYDKYTQSRTNDSNEHKSSSISNLKLDECLSKLERINLNELSRTDLFGYLVDLLDRLIAFIFNSKRDHSQELFAFFKNTNLIVIQFYEFVNRMLNVFNETLLFPMGDGSGGRFNGSAKISTSRENKNIIVCKAFELLHVLIISKTKPPPTSFYSISPHWYRYLDKHGEHDEYAVSFCNLVATSFNFTSPICRLIVSANKSRSDQDTILTEKNLKIGFSILNELTANNRLLLIDNSVKQLIYEILDRM